MLFSIRDLDDFFRPRTDKVRDSDLRATDFFGYQSPGPFLSSAERETINQWVAHLTYQPVWTHTTGIAPDSSRYWNTAELVGKAARAVFDFFDYIDRELSTKQPDKAKEIRQVKAAFQHGLSSLENLATKETARFADKRRGAS